MDELDGFFDLVRGVNPFLDNRVNGLSADTVTVDEIHSAAFDRLAQLANDACQSRRGLGAVLWGEAGIGKSHLLARVTKWAEQQQTAVALYLHNLQASPENLPRSLVKSMVSILTRGQVNNFTSTPFYDLVLAFVKESLDHDESKHHPWPAVISAWSAMVDRLGTEDFARAAPVDRTVFAVLLRFFRSAYRAHKTGDERIAALAARWLAGDFLDAEQAGALKLAAGPNGEAQVALADNQQIKQVIIALSRIAMSAKQPLVLCFDQVDNLDDAQAAALSRFLEAVIDSAPNLLVITAGIQATLLRWREIGVIQQSAWDRLTQFEINPQRLTPEQSARIVAARVDKVVTPFAELQEVHERMDQNRSFPLGRAWMDEFFQGRVDVRPRDVINGARLAWQRQQDLLKELGGCAWLKEWRDGQSPPASSNDLREWSEQQIVAEIDKTVTETLAGLQDRQLQALKTQPPDPMLLADVVMRLIQHSGELEIEKPPLGKPDRQFPFNLISRRRPGNNGQAQRTGLLVMHNTSATTTTATLRWLDKLACAPERMVLVTIAGLELTLGAQPNARGRGYYDALRQRGPAAFQHLQLSHEDCAHLLALDQIAGLARSGEMELSIAGSKRQISERDAVSSLHRQGRYLECKLLGQLLGAK